MKNPRGINEASLAQRLRGYVRHPMSLVMMLLVMLAAALTFFVLLYIIGYILVKGVPHLTPSLFALEYNTENVSLFPAIINTISITFLSLLIAAPLSQKCSYSIISSERTKYPPRLPLRLSGKILRTPSWIVTHPAQDC